MAYYNPCRLTFRRELFNAERLQNRQELEDLQGALRAARACAAKDEEWKTQLEETYRKLLVEKRELLVK